MTEHETHRSVDNPFTADEFEKIRALRSRLQRLDALLARLDTCGIACTSHHEIRDRLDAFLETIETEFLRDGSPA